MIRFVLCGLARIIPAAAFVIGVSSWSVLHPEVIILHDDTIVDGRIISEDATSVTIRSENRASRIARSDIREILYQFSDERERQSALAELRNAPGQDDQELLQIMTRSEREAWERGERASQADQYDVWSAVWRSAVLPGWGQALSSRSSASTGFALGAFVAGTLWSYSHLHLRALDGEYYGGVVPELRGAALWSGWNNNPLLFGVAYIEEQRLYNARVDATRTRFNASLVFAAVYVWNLLDAYFFYPAQTTAWEPREAGWSFSGNLFMDRVQNANVQIIAEWSF